MNRRRRFQRPGLVIGVWATVLLLMFMGGVAYNHWLGAYVAGVRATDPNPALTRAEEFMAQSRYLEALEQIDDAQTRAPEHPRVWKVRGDFYFRREEYRRAAEAYEHALQLGWADKSVPVNYVWSLIRLELFDEAAHWGKDFMKRHDTPLLPRYVAEAYIRQGNRIDAIPYLERAHAATGDDTYLMSNLVSSYRAAGRTEDADEMQERLHEVRARMQDLNLPAPE
jgi:tetratricopeptide (TPR) repeat protein